MNHYPIPHPEFQNNQWEQKFVYKQIRQLKILILQGYLPTQMSA